MATTDLLPFAPEWLEFEKALGFRPLLLGTPAVMREQYAFLGAANAPFTPPVCDDVVIEDHVLGEGLSVRVYSPKSKVANGAIGLKFFAGGWTIGSVEAEHYLSYFFAQQTNTVIVAVNYRLAPEHKYPAAHDDAKTALSWVVDNADTLGVSLDKIYTVGTSAGGQMAVSLALSTLDAKYNIKGVIALAPVTVHPEAIPVELADQFGPEKNTDAAIINAETMKIFLESYGAPPSNPEFSILLHPELARLPPTYLAVCGKDPLRDEGLAFKRLLNKESIVFKSDFFEGLPHVFWANPSFSLTQPSLETIIKGMNWVISQI